MTLSPSALEADMNVSDDAGPGLSKREYMATAILAGLCANPGGPYQANGMNGWGLVNCAMHDVAHEAVNLADALLRELVQP